MSPAHPCDALTPTPTLTLHAYPITGRFTTLNCVWVAGTLFFPSKQQPPPLARHHHHGGDDDCATERGARRVAALCSAP